MFMLNVGHVIPAGLLREKISSWTKKMELQHTNNPRMKLLPCLGGIWEFLYFLTIFKSRIDVYVTSLGTASVRMSCCLLVGSIPRY